jgi:hypothetical protein
MGSDFPDTEEVTGFNPVRPTTFFEIASSSESKNEPATCGYGIHLAGDRSVHRCGSLYKNVLATLVSLQCSTADLIERGTQPVFPVPVTAGLQVHPELPRGADAAQLHGPAAAATLAP